MTENTDDLFERNLAALKSFNPGLYQQMVAITEPAAQVVGRIETRDINIDLGHTLLYPTDAQSHAERQLAEFRASPHRFYMNPPIHHLGPHRDYHHDHVSAAVYDFMKGEGLSSIPNLPADDAGFLVIYGIGLGFHLPALFDELEVRHFILAEEFIELMYHTLRLIDWAAIFNKVNERGQTVQFFFNRDPMNLAERIHWTMRGRYFGLLDGSYIFRHYSSMVLDEAYAEFREKLPLLPISIGYVEDEWIMLTHCGTNLIRNDFLLLEDHPRLEKNLPAFVIGSGPSLDQSIEAIKRLQGQAIIFSSGTGILPLLRNGIRPDFHCELENGVASYEHLKRTADQYNLDGITLIASTTVWPELPRLFDKRVFYFRDSVCSTGLWAPDHTGLYGTAPTCTNLAIRAALLLCFRQIYLFGVDLGSRDPEKHHSQDAIYYRSDEWGQNYKQNQDVMDIEMPANFGGKAYTNATLHWTRMMMTQGLEMFTPYSKIYNCSDGVQIPGTFPKLPRTLKSDAPMHRKRAILQRLETELISKRAGEMLPAAELQTISNVFNTWYDNLFALIDDARRSQMPFMEFYEKCMPFLVERGEIPYQAALRSVHVGTLMICFQIGFFFYRRVGSDLKSGMMNTYLLAVRERLELIRKDFGLYFGALIKQSETEYPL